MSKGNTKRCPFCAEEIKLEAIKCKYCKSNLDGSPAVQQNEQKQASSFIEATNKLTKEIKKPKEGLFLQTLNFGCAIIFIFIVIIVIGIIIAISNN